MTVFGVIAVIGGRISGKLAAKMGRKKVLALGLVSAILGNQNNIPPKYKALINVAVAAALGSETCTKNQTAMALKSGATKQEIVEALLCARMNKSSTVFSAALAGLELLADQK